MRDSINQHYQKIKGSVKSYREEVFISLIMVLVGTASFGAGVLSSKEGGSPIALRQSLTGEAIDLSTLTQKPNTGQSASVGGALGGGGEEGRAEGSIVASKNGVAYYLPGCGGANRILDKNKIYFKTEAEAQSAGYRIAANCKR